MPKTADTITRLVKRAEECRFLAGIATDKDDSQSYLTMADAYELLAEQERKLLLIRQKRDAAFIARLKPK